MRLLVGSFALLIAGSVIAQVDTRKEVKSTKDIMTVMTIPASTALFNVPEKPTDSEWSELRRQALILSDSGTLLSDSGRLKSGSVNPSDWNDAAKSLRDAAQMALKAIEKKDPDLLMIDVGEKILDSCSSCHEKYLPKQ